MQKFDTLVPLRDLLHDDLETLCIDLQSEFAQMGGGRLLVTGGGGFLGYYLIQAVLHWNDTRAAGARIKTVVYDNYVRGVPEWLEALRKHPDLELVRQDMIQPLPADMGHFDYIVHAAGIASPMYYRAQPLKCIDANINGLRNLLDYAVAERVAGRPVKAFLFYSSSEIYGDPAADSIPTPETYRGNVSCTGPRACYDESKRFGETLCVVFTQQHAIPTKIARPFNNYGPGLKISDKRVISDFAREVIAGRDIVMYSDGKPTRTFCYSADSITGYYKVLVRGHPGEPYNIGTEKPEISMNELAERIIATAGELFGYGGKLVRKPNPEANYLVDNPNRRCPNIDKSRSQLGYNPTISIDEGLRRAMIWYFHNHEAEEA